MADYMKIPAANLCRAPEQACILADAVATFVPRGSPAGAGAAGDDGGAGGRGRRGAAHAANGAAGRGANHIIYRTKLVPTGCGGVDKRLPCLSPPFL